MILVNVHLITWLLFASNVITWGQVIRKDLVGAADNERDKRAVDFGLFVRNLLLKSATASNTKANISRNVLNSKTTTFAPRRRTTTTTTAAPFFFNKGPFKFAFDLSGPISNKFNNGGYINFDYNDYGGQQPFRPGRRQRPTTTTTTTTTTTAAPPSPPTRRKPVPRRPYGLVGKQNLQYDYYDDYDYDYDNADKTPASTAAPAPTPAPTPNPPAAKPKKRPTVYRTPAQGRVPQLRNRFVYQYRQPYDTSTNNDAAQPPNDKNSQTPKNSDNDETSTDTNDYTEDVYNDSDAAVNDESEGLSNVPGVSNNNNPNVEQEYNDSSDNDNPNVNPNTNNGNENGVVSSATTPAPLPNSNFNADQQPFQGRFGVGGYLNGPLGFGNFGPSGGYQYSPYNDFNSPYQSSSPTGYSLRYY